MIPQNFITEWKNQAPWKDNAQIEQDLILSRAIVEILFSEEAQLYINYILLFKNAILKTLILFKKRQALLVAP